MDVRRRYQGIRSVFLLVLLVAPLSITILARPAHAADPVEKVTALNKKALDEYKKRDYEAARALLKEALEICNSSGLDTHPIKARTHIHLGIVSIVGFKERDLGIKHFRKALEIQPDIKLTKMLITRDLSAAFDEAVAAGGGAGGGAETAGGDTGGAAPADQQGEEGGASEGGSAPRASGGDDDDGEPKKPVRVRRAPPPRKKKVSDEDGDGGDSGGSGGDDNDEGAPAYKIYIAVAFGSGAGIASGNGELDPTAHQLKSAGFAPAQAGQITPEVGYFVSPTFLLSARLRVQYVSGLTGKMVTNTGCGSDMYCSPTPWGVTGFARGSFFFGGDKMRLFAGPEIGAGNIRHAQAFSSDKTCGHTGAIVSCVDSLPSGPIFLGGAFGVLYDMSSAVGLVGTVVADAGFGKFTLNFDVNVGVAAHF
jgi:hypothetical protein